MRNLEIQEKSTFLTQEKRARCGRISLFEIPIDSLQSIQSSQLVKCLVKPTLPIAT